MASLFTKWDPAILRPEPPHARNNMCVGWMGPEQRCENQLPLDRVAAGRELIHNLSTMHVYDIDYPNLRGGLGGTVSDCLCHLHGDQVQLVEINWMTIIKVEARRVVRGRAEAVKGPIEEWLDGIDPECERGPGQDES